MRTLKLEIVEYTDEATWTWRLLDANGVFLGDHRVELDRGSTEFEALSSLSAYLRWHLAGETTEAELVGRVATRVREKAFGPIAAAILAQAEQEPTTVVVAVPREAEPLLYCPFELAFVLDPSPGARDVSLVYEVGADAEKKSDKNPVGTRLRLLAIFSAPSDQTALNVRRERHELRRLIQRLALTDGRAIDLRIVQYGATRELLESILEEGEGWDLIHFSGHGLPAGLILEKADGSAYRIQSSELTELLRPARDRLKLVTLSSCESGAANAVQALQSLGVGVEEEAEEAGPEADRPSPLPALAQRLTDEIGCAVLAMRYPVEDGFAIDLAGDLYDGLLGHGQTLPRALQRALQKGTAPGRDVSKLSLSTPALFGAAALGLAIEAPLGDGGEAARFGSLKLAYFEPEPERFVGRVRQLARASAALAPESPHRVVVFHGMVGAGKSACALELAYRHEERRFGAMAWHRAPSEGDDITDALAQFATALDLQLEGFELAHVIDDEAKLTAFLPRLRQQMAERSLLIVLDNAESLLDGNGNWRDARWGQVIAALGSHDGLSRLVLTSRVAPASLREDPRALVESIDSLSPGESVLLASQLPNLGRLLSDESEIGQPAGRELVRRTLEIVQGNPKLIELADRQATDAATLEARLAEADGAWEERADLSAFFRTGGPDDAIGADDFLRVIESWARAITGALSPTDQLAFQILCCLEPGDRRKGYLEAALPIIWGRLGREDEPPALDAALNAAADQGLVEIEPRRDDDARYLVHAAVESAERGSVGAETREIVDAAMAAFWSTVHRKAVEAGNPGGGRTAGLSAAPYLLRLGHTEPTVGFIEWVITHDTSPNTTAAAMPLLRRALDLAKTPAEERHARLVLLRCRSALRGADITEELKELIELSRRDGNLGEVSVARGDLIGELLRKGRPKEALELLETPIDLGDGERSNEWSLIGDETQRLQAIHQLGDNTGVLAAIGPLLERIDKAEEVTDGKVRFFPNQILEAVFETGRSAALGTKNWKLAIEFTAAIRDTEKLRDPSPIERARTDLNDVSPLIELDELDEAETVLRRIRGVAEEAGDLHLLGSIFGAWAALESVREHHDEAIAFSRRALRTRYQYGEPHSINVGHHNLASALARQGGAPEEIVVHRLAEALISYQTDSGEYPRDLDTLASALSRYGTERAPTDFDGLCEGVRSQAQVDFASFFAGLRKDADGEAAMRAVVADVNEKLRETEA